ncbi:AAA family ATPase [Bacillus sp. B-jedd]|uniref:AAA family ATPase n=1 Tax=Bacillus sp. B-jedd TaxID=1476857 RepID=UPI0005157155|nr:AAA family ATPase [Bacillus sp. B-jedd]CEG28318.1 cobyrinic acid ac-diamide synthase [Bacillus sp. B-jedd]
MTWFVVAKHAEVYEELKKHAIVLNSDVKWLKSKGDLAENTEKGLVFLTVTRDDSMEDLYEELRTFSDSGQGIPILIDLEGQVDIRKAIRAGAYDVLPYPVSIETMKETVKEAGRLLMQEKAEPKLEAPKQAASDKKARIITVCSTKGGVGKTTFTVNLAAAFAKQRKKVAVVDLDLQFGDVAMFFDCKPKKTIYEWVKEEYYGQPEKLSGYMHSANEYIDIMAAPIRPEFSEVILEEHVQKLADYLRPHYDVVLFDTAPYVEGNILTALEKSDDIFLVTFLDLPTLKNCKIFIDTLESLALVNKAKIVLNRDSKKRGMNKETAEEVLGMKIHTRIPDLEKVVVTSVNEGNPFVYSYPRAKISKVMYSLAQDFFGKPEKKKKRSLFAKKVVNEGGLV